MLEFPEQVLKFVGRGTGGGGLGHFCVQAWTDNLFWGPFLILLALLGVVQVSFSYGLGASIRPTVRL